MVDNLLKFGFTKRINIDTCSTKGNSEAQPCVKKNKGRSDTKKAYELKRQRNFQDSWTELYPWVQYNEDKNEMYCSYCRLFLDIADKKSTLFIGTSNFTLETLKYLGGHLKGGIKPSEKHLACEAKYKLKEKKREMHEKTQTVTTSGESSVQVSLCQALGPMDQIIRNLSQKRITQLASCFRSAYFIAKMELPFTLYPEIMNLQEINGLQIPVSYRSDNSCRR